MPPGHDSAIPGGMTVIGQAGMTGAGMIAGAGATTGAGTTVAGKNARVAGTTVAAVTGATGVALGEAGRLREGAANAATRPTIVNAGGSDGIRIRIGGEREKRERQEGDKGSKLTNPFRFERTHKRCCIAERRPTVYSGLTGTTMGKGVRWASSRRLAGGR